MTGSSKITYHQQVSYCGKPHCRRCREGLGHGPYWYSYQVVDGRTIRTYVGKHLPAGTQGALGVVAEARDTASAQDLAGAVVRLYVLGQFRLEYKNEQRQWQPVTDATLQHQRVRALLHCLVSSPGRKLGREQAIDMLWPDLDFETATNRLDKAVYDLRRLLEPRRGRLATSNLLLTEHSTLMLAGQQQLWIDADAFESLLNQVRASSDPGQTEQLLEEAMLLYSGDYLPEERDILWIQARREALQRSWIGLLLELADLRIARENLSSAIDTLDHLLVIDPANEAAVQRLVILLAQSGRRAEALRIYQRFAAVLRQEYRIEPLPETRALYEAARRGKNPAAHMQTGASSGASLLDAQLPEAQLLEAPPTGEHAYVQVGRSNQSPLVGREHELEILHRNLLATEQARRMKLAGQKKATGLALDAQRRPQCVILMGDVGIGKTRLAEETGREAKKRGWALAWTRAYAQESSIPYHMWVEALRKAMTQGLWQRQEIARRPLIYQSLRTLLPELQDLLPQEALPPAASPEQEQLRLWEATRALLATISENTPLFIVLDDLQWADSSSCELLAYLVRQLRGQPVMIVGTCREIELPANHPLRPVLVDLHREQAVETLTIQRLSNEQIRALVSPLPEPVVSYIQASAAGNPFFAEELARGIGASHYTASQQTTAIVGTAHNGSTTYAAPQPTAPETIGGTQFIASNSPGITNYLYLPTTLPGTISAVLDLRLGRISSACQRLLVRAAVLGGSFEFNTICAMEAGGPDADEDTILDLLEEALQAGMLTEEGSGTRITYYFWHPLLVSHLYDGLSAGRRASLHRRVAEVLRQTYQGREQEGAAAISYHLVNGGGESSQIAYYAELAGDRAYALSAYPEAVQHYRLAVEHIGTLPAHAGFEEHLHLANLLERLGESTRIQGNYPEARRYFERALEVHSQHRLSASHSNPQYESQIEALLWCAIGRTWFDTGDNVHARQCYSRGEEVLYKAGIATGPAWANLHLQQGYVLWLEGNFEEAHQTTHHALDIFEDVLRRQNHVVADGFHSTATRRTLEGDPADLGRAHRLLAGIAASVGQSTSALDHLSTALTIFEQYDRQSEIAIICCNIGDVYLRKAEHGLAQAALRRSLSTAERVGELEIMAAGFGNLGMLSARFGDLPEAEVYFKRGLVLAEQVNDPIYTSLLYSYLATIMQDQGKINEAKTSLCQALRVGRAMKLTFCIGAALVALGHLHITQAIANQNNSGLLETTRRQRNTSHTHFLKRARIALQRALTLEGLEAETRTEGKLTLAQVSLLLGEIDTAQQQVTQAMEESRRLEQTWLLAYAQRLVGEILSVQGKQEQANEYFEQALATFHKCDMRLEWARTLQSYGVALLERHNKDDGSFRQGVKYLQEARKAFGECNAVLDLQGIERMLSKYTPVTAAPTRKRDRQGR
jgi:DNA-binding SARP family transcriptional activator/Tfp pilus assembly protein PilF